MCVTLGEHMRDHLNITTSCFTMTKEGILQKGIL